MIVAAAYDKKLSIMHSHTVLLKGLEAGTPCVHNLAWAYA